MQFQTILQDMKARGRPLQTLFGVGEILATSFAAEVFRPGRFERPEEVTSSLG
jgi:transposase